MTVIDSNSVRIAGQPYHPIAINDTRSSCAKGDATHPVGFARGAVHHQKRLVTTRSGIDYNDRLIVRRLMHRISRGLANQALCLMGSV